MSLLRAKLASNFIDIDKVLMKIKETTSEGDVHKVFWNFRMQNLSYIKFRRQQ